MFTRYTIYIQNMTLGDEMMKKNSNNNVFAIGLIAVGILLILKVFNIPFFNNFNIGNLIGIVWPLFILVPGINMLRRKIDFGGILLTFLGGSFLLDNFLELFGLNYNSFFIFKFFWPLLLVFMGYRILTSDKKNSTRFDDESYDDEYVKSKYESVSNDQKSKSITFNSKKFIYNSETMLPGISQLDLNITFGGAEILIEEGIQVILVGQYTFGGHEFFGTEAGGIHSEIKEVRYAEQDDDHFDRTLIINAGITFGGIEVRRR